MVPLPFPHCKVIFGFILLLMVDLAVTSPFKPRSKSRTISLKNANPNLVVLNITSAPYQNVTDQTEINPDSEQISLPNNRNNNNSDKVLERLILNTTQNNLGPNFDEVLLDFSAYLTKPFVFDYTKALNEAVEQAKNEVLTTNYHLHESKFEGSNLNLLEDRKTNTESTPNRFTETSHENIPETGPRAEKLVRQLIPDETTIYRNFDETKLPLGFAFFEALREQNNRPYFEAFAQTTTQAPIIPTTTALPPTEAIVTDGPSSFYRRRNSKKTFEFENDKYENQDENDENPDFARYTHDNSAETSSDHDAYHFDDTFNPYYNEESEETTEEPKITITNTDTNSYGSKPGMKFNRYSRLKLIQEQKPITKVKPKRRTSSTNNSPVKISLHKKPTRKSINISPYLYDNESYHPNESKEFLIVVTTPPTTSSAEDQTGSASNQQQWRQVAPRYSALNRPRPQDVEHVQPVTSRPKVPSVPRTTKSPSVRKPSQQKPPEEMRYFQ